MAKKETYSFREIREILKEIAREEFDEKIKCQRCKRFFDPNEEIMYYIAKTEEELEEEKGFIVCYECRPKVKKALMEQLI